MGRIAAIPFFHPKNYRERIEKNTDKPYFFNQAPNYLQKIFTSIEIDLEAPCTAIKVLNPELGVPLMVIDENHLDTFKEYLLQNSRYIPKFKGLKELLDLFRPDAYCMNYMHKPKSSQGTLFLEAKFCLLNEEINILKKIDEYTQVNKEDFFQFLEEWVGLVINIAAEYIMFKLQKPAIFFSCEKCYRPALFIKAPKFGADGNIISEHQKLWGTANIVDVLIYTAEKYGFDKKKENDNDKLIQENIIYYDESFFHRNEEVYSDCEFFQRHINGAFILTTDIKSFSLIIEKIKNNGSFAQFDLIVTGSKAEKILQLLQDNDYSNYINSIFIYTLSPDKYNYLLRKSEKIKKIFFDKGELIDYIKDNEIEKPIYQLTKLITYEDYLYKYHILHEMISEQYGNFTGDSYDAAIALIKDFLYWYPHLKIEQDENFKGTKIELLISTLQNFKDINSNEEEIIKIYTKNTGSFYGDFNQWLRELDPFAYKKISWFIASLMYQLNDYGKTNGITTSKTFYRGIKMNYSDLLYYRRCKGKMICFPGFTSSSENLEVAENFGKQINSTDDSDNLLTLDKRQKQQIFLTIIIINYKFREEYVSSAIDISKCSDYPDEMERLFLPFSFFKINEVEIKYEEYIAFIKLDTIGRKEILEKKINNSCRLSYNQLGFMELNKI